MPDWKAGDWCIYEWRIGQITELRENGSADFSDGTITSGGYLLAERFRPLTLENKRIADWFENRYRALRRIRGESGFNYPGIAAYFARLAGEAMNNEDREGVYLKVDRFIRGAEQYDSLIDGIPLFRAGRDDDR